MKIKHSKSRKWTTGKGCIQGSTLSMPLFCLVTVVMDMIIDEEVVSYADNSLVIVDADDEAELCEKVFIIIDQVTQNRHLLFCIYCLWYHEVLRLD